MAEPAVLLDIDGTLVDTTYLHTMAWWRACHEVGELVTAAAVHRLIGAGAGVLMRELLGEERPDVKQGWRRHLDRLKPEVKALPGATDLVRTLHQRGATVVLATSSEPEDLDDLLAVIDAPEAIDIVIGAGDVEEAKPAPDIFQVSLERSGTDPDDALAVGDTVWDVKAASAAGVACACVLTGGAARSELEQEGAVAVYRDAAELLGHLDHGPLARLLSKAPR